MVETAEMQPNVGVEGQDENQMMNELRRLEQSARNYQQEVSLASCNSVIPTVYSEQQCKEIQTYRGKQAFLLLSFFESLSVFKQDFTIR